MDKVFIEDLEIETIIGIFGWEREVKQIVNINLEMDFDISKAGKTDNIDDALNYKSIGTVSYTHLTLPTNREV